MKFQNTSRVLLGVLLALMFPGLPNVCAQQDQLKIGDLVEFEFGANKLEGQIVGFYGFGMLDIKCIFMDSVTTLGHRSEDVRLVESARYEVRTWTSVDGKFSMEGRAVDLKGNKLHLEKKDGEIIKVPLSKLCKDDNQYVRDAKSGKILPTVSRPINGDIPGLMGGIDPANLDPAQMAREVAKAHADIQAEMADLQAGIVKAPASVGGLAITPFEHTKIEKYREAPHQPESARGIPANVSACSVPIEYDSGGSPLHESFSRPVLSPDGNRAAVVGHNPMKENSQIFIIDIPSQKVLVHQDLKCEDALPLPTFRFQRPVANDAPWISSLVAGDFIGERRVV